MKFTIISIFFTTYYVLSAGQVDEIPEPSHTAQPCLHTLNETGLTLLCQTQAKLEWPYDRSGVGVNKWGTRNLCCSQYSEIDCQLNVISSGKCTGDSAHAAIYYQHQLISHWSTGQCLAIPYHSKLCSYDDIGVSHTCGDRIGSILRECRENSAEKWNITIQHMSGKDTSGEPFGFCCALWELYDCALDAVKDHCKDELHSAQDEINQSIKALVNWKCAEHTYHSTVCGTDQAGSAMGNEFYKLFLLISILKMLF